MTKMTKIQGDQNCTQNTSKQLIVFVDCSLCLKADLQRLSRKKNQGKSIHEENIQKMWKSASQILLRKSYSEREKSVYLESNVQV